MIKAIITDFDGTLVDTFEANYNAYYEVLDTFGISLTRERYRDCFGLRFDEFMNAIGVVGDPVFRKKIRDLKKEVYPKYFNCIKLNTELVQFLSVMRRNGLRIAIASTASKDNLTNVLHHFGLINLFDDIITGEYVSNGKPDPEVYIFTMERIDVEPDEVLIFEDSKVGIQAAQASGASVIKIKEKLF